MAKKATKTARKEKPNFLQYLWRGLVFLWQHPLIITVIMLVLAGYMFTVVTRDTLADYMNCDYLITQRLGAPSFLCDGYTLKVGDLPGMFGSLFGGGDLSTKANLENAIRGSITWIFGQKSLENIFVSISGVGVAIDDDLELIRKIVAWSVVVFFALFSFFLTFLATKIRSVIKLLLLNKEEWRNFMFGLRTWAFIFVAFCAVFYYFVIR